MATYWCDGMPTMAGCNEVIEVTRRWTKPGKKKSGWLATPALAAVSDDSPLNDPSQWYPTDTLLTFCPECAVVVGKQIAQQEATA